VVWHFPARRLADFREIQPNEKLQPKAYREDTQKMSRSLITLMILFVCYTGGATMANANTGETLRAKGKGQESYGHLTTNDYVRDIVNHPAFKGFGELMLPLDDNTSYYGRRLNYCFLMRN
jgi:hypothetical protein